jgi:hypothetical protein
MPAKKSDILVEIMIFTDAKIFGEGVEVLSCV